ncbi:MAG: PAS domain-containing protein [Kiritimatiellae bacterium]|nr:PAS domain-containing protein [Kiritimatiellia bacterium]
MEQGTNGAGGQAAEASWPELIVIVLMRVVVISAFVVVLAALLPADKGAFYSFMVFAYIATIPYALWLKNRARTARVVPLQFVVDLLWVTGIVYFTGGVDSEMFLLYPLVILSTGIIAGPVLAVQITVLGTLVYVILIVLMARGILLPLRPTAGPTDWARIGEALGLRLFVFAAFGAASVYMSQKMQYADRSRELFRQVAEIIFRHVHAGLMLLDPRGRVLMVNDRACKLLGRSEKDLVGRPLTSVMPEDGGLDPTATNGNPRPRYFTRPDGAMFPASLNISRVVLPAQAVPGLKVKPGETADVLLLAFSDISSLVEAQEQAKYTEQMKVAARMASEIAHEVRNPLTSISGTVQLLKKLEDQAAKGDAQSAEILREERAGMYARVFDESSRLDRIIERFIDHAEFSPEALARLFQYEDEMRAECSHPPEPQTEPVASGR